MFNFPKTLLPLTLLLSLPAIAMDEKPENLVPNSLAQTSLVLATVTAANGQTGTLLARKEKLAAEQAELDKALSEEAKKSDEARAQLLAKLQERNERLTGAEALIAAELEKRKALEESKKQKEAELATFEQTFTTQLSEIEKTLDAFKKDKETLTKERDNLKAIADGKVTKTGLLGLGFLGL